MPRLTVPQAGYVAGKELAYAANETGVVTALATSNASLGVSVVVPQLPYPVWLEAGVFVDVTTAPAALASGTVTLSVTDNQGSPVTVGAAIASFEGNAGTAGLASMVVRCRLAANTASRTYTLFAARGADSTFRASVMNGSVAAAFRSYLAAFVA